MMKLASGWLSSSWSPPDVLRYIFYHPSTTQLLWAGMIDLEVPGGRRLPRQKQSEEEHIFAGVAYPARGKGSISIETPSATQMLTLEQPSPSFKLCPPALPLNETLPQLVFRDPVEFLMLAEQAAAEPTSRFSPWGIRMVRGRCFHVGKEIATQLLIPKKILPIFHLRHGTTGSLSEREGHKINTWNEEGSDISSFKIMILNWRKVSR